MTKICYMPRITYRVYELEISVRLNFCSLGLLGMKFFVVIMNSYEPDLLMYRMQQSV